MESRLSLHSQLSSIMETMARSTLSQVCSLVDEDSSELRLELSRLLFVNSALTEKVNNLQSELTTARSDAPTPCKHYRTVGVQTVCHWDGDAPVSLVSGPPTIEGIFGKDWCMDLWKDRDPYSVERVSDSPQSSDASDQIAVSDVIDEEDDVEDAASSCRQETLSTEERDECLAEEQERLSVGYSVDGSTCNLSYDQDEEQIVSTGEELSSDTEEAFSTHIIPIEEEEEEEEEEDEDDVQFVQESHQEPTINAEGGSKQVQTVAANSENSTAPDKDSRDNFNVLNVETNGDPTKGKFACQICSRTFFHKSTLTHHMKSHKSNICNVCKQHFPHRTKLKTHTCVPSALSRRVSRSCELCGKTFANPSALRTHYVVHTGEKPYRCSLCGRGFTQKGNLKCHLRIHTGERPFRCVKCGKTFTQKVNLNHHLMAHKNHQVVGE